MFERPGRELDRRREGRTTLPRGERSLLRKSGRAAHNRDTRRPSSATTRGTLVVAGMQKRCGVAEPRRDELGVRETHGWIGRSGDHDCAASIYRRYVGASSAAVSGVTDNRP